LISGIVQVNDCFQSSGLLALSINRFVLNGCLQQDLAQLRTLRSAEAFTSPCLSPTSSYCSSWSPACCAFAGVGVHFIFRTSFGNRWGIICRFMLVVMLLSHCIRRSSGCHLARYCHRLTTPASGKPGWFIIVHTTFLYLSPFYSVVAPFFECER
jgi:hypothetical protein